MEKIYKNCQSCSIPLKKDPKGGGTHADQTLSTMYCSYCYQNGAFKQPHLTVQEMQNLVKEKMKEKGFPSFIASFFTRSIPKLERWKDL